MKKSRSTASDRGQLADRIRSARRAAKLTQTALAESVGVTPSAAAQWEHPNGTRPDLSRLEAIATLTGVTFAWLATGRGEQRRRRHSQDDGTPALRLDVFAQDATEEMLLERFRAISPKARQMLTGLLEELGTGRRRL